MSSPVASSDSAAVPARAHAGSYGGRNDVIVTSVRVVDDVAARLGNTPTICRKCYVHPAIIDAYLTGSIGEIVERQSRSSRRPMRGLRPEEIAVLELLRNKDVLDADRTPG